METVGYRARWVLAENGAGTSLLPGATVVVRADRIVDVMSMPSEGKPDHMVDLGETLLMPGFINAHTHCVSGPLFRGLIEDVALEDGPGSVIDAIMLPLGDIATEICTTDDIRAIAKLGQLEAIKAGSTTVVDMPRTRHEAFAEAAEEMGLRAYIHPYLMSPIDDRTATDAQAQGMAARQIKETFGKWFERFDGRGQGRIRIGLGPHAPDTCSPALLRAVAQARDEFGARVTTHASQTVEEGKVIADRFGMSPIAYLDSVGLLTPDLIVAHCVYAGDADLRLLAERGVPLAHCPLSFARVGVMASFARFADQGVTTLIGSDAHALDILADIRLASINSKFHTGDSAAGSARDIVRAATEGAADALGRSDLGRLRKGAAADMVGISLGHPHTQPVYDPIRTAVWNGSGRDVSFVMVAGVALVEGGVYLHGDERGIVERGAAALHAVWDLARQRNVLRDGTL